MPFRCAAILRPIRVATLLPVVVLATLLSGCVTKRVKSTPETQISSQRVSQADSLAAFATGILLQNRAVGDTNLTQKAALEALQRAFRANPDSRNALLVLANGLEQESRHREALTAFETYLKRHPSDVEVHVLAARAAEECDELLTAAHHCATILHYQPDEYDIALALIRFYFQAGRNDQALAAIRHQLQTRQDEKGAAVALAWSTHFAFVDEQPKLALKCIALAIPHSTNATQRAYLTAVAGQQHLNLGQTNTARRTWLEAFHHEPCNLDPLRFIGASFSTEANAERQLAHFTKRKIDPTTALLIKAAMYQAQQQSTNCVATLRQLYQLPKHQQKPRCEEFFLWYAGALIDNHEPDREVIDVLETALTEHPDSHTTKNFLAYTLALKSEQLPKALRLVNEALAADPQNAAYLDTRGWVLYKQERHNEALQFLLKAAEALPDDPEVLDHIVVVLKELGHNAESIFVRTRLNAITTAQTQPE